MIKLVKKMYNMSTNQVTNRQVEVISNKDFMYHTESYTTSDGRNSVVSFTLGNQSGKYTIEGKAKDDEDFQDFKNSLEDIANYLMTNDSMVIVLNEQYYGVGRKTTYTMKVHSLDEEMNGGEEE